MRASRPLVLLGMVILTGPHRAWAHQEPSGCIGGGGHAQLFVTFADGSDATGATFTPCESIHYVAKLCPSGGNTCNYQGDAQTTWTITTPDGVPHNVLPPGGIPLITLSSPCFSSLVVDYTVNVAGPALDASADATRLITHSGPTDLRSRAGTGIANDEGTCPASTQCADSVCDPDLQFMTGRCSTTTDQLCPANPDCPGGETCVLSFNRKGGCTFDNKLFTTPCEADGDLCTIDHCDGAGNCVLDRNVSCQAPVPPCEGGRRCEPSTGQCVDNSDAQASTVCEADNDRCTLDHCDGAGNCVFQENNPACALGCRITGGGIGCDVTKNANCVAEVSKATFGGQVGAPCGCIGCFDEFGHIQGNWTYSRKQRQGSFHAMDFNSLVCGCDGDFTNGLCNPGNRPPGPEPPRAPANMACFSGVGQYSPTGGRRTLTVAFRVEVEDRSEPGGVNGAPPPDVYRIRIWIPVPSSGETASELAAGACCTNATPTGRAARRPDIDDGGDLLHGNLQIHPELGHSAAGICPVPSGRCVP